MKRHLWIHLSCLAIVTTACGADPTEPAREEIDPPASLVQGLLTITTCPALDPAIAPPLSPGPGNTCAVHPPEAGAGGATGLLVRGTVLAPNEVLRGGELLIDSNGVIACVGCNCQASPGYAAATRIDCAGAISPGLVNSHEHLGCWDANVSSTPVAQYAHRSQWRSRTPDPDGYPNVPYTCSNPSPLRMAVAEMRHVASGTTSIAGANGVVGLARNLDVMDVRKQKELGRDQREGVTAHVYGSVDPLGGATVFGEVQTNCSPGVTPPRYHAADAALFHVGEGISAGALNEVNCTVGGSRDTVFGNGTLIHGIRMPPAKAQTLRQRGAWFSWSPRSNIQLYGDTAPVTMLDRMGVGIALGTDWPISGSVNLSRELACARSLNEARFANHFTDFDFWRMITTNAAFATGVDRKLGMLKKGYLADVAVFDGSTYTDHSAVVRGEPRTVALVLRGGEALYGDLGVLAGPHPWLDRSACLQKSICGADKRVCISQQEYDLATPYFVRCGTEPEPNCTPARAAAGPLPAYPGTPATDPDGDGLPAPGLADKCAAVFDPIKPGQALQDNADSDALGDACDPCPLTSGSCTALDDDDLDGDTRPNGTDNCPMIPNSSQADGDADGVGDACECTEAAPCVLPIEVVRDEQALGYPGDDAWVRVVDLYVTAIRADGFFAQRPPTSVPAQYLNTATTDYGNAGIFVYRGTAPTTPAVAVGDKVTVTGRMYRYYGLNELKEVSYPAPLPGTLPFGAVDKHAYRLATFSVNGAVWTGEIADQFEGMLVKSSTLKVVNANPDAPSDFNEFSVIYTAQNVPPYPHGLRIDDYLHNYVPQLAGKRDVGDLFTEIAGVLVHTYDNHKLAPRAATDLVPNP